jgi:1,4-alpha-glucan branching enzyme
MTTSKTARGALRSKRTRQSGPVLGEQDVYLFREGTHTRLASFMGCELGAEEATFRVWAPNATRVAVIGDWNGWADQVDSLAPRADHTGIWEGTVRGVAQGQAYKYRIETRDGERLDKADPFARFAEAPPLTASRAWALDYDWGDAQWMAARAQRP